jgi:hypothetical protein
VDSENGKIDFDQPGVDIRLEILDQIPERLIDDDDKQDGREMMEEGSDPMIISGQREGLIR